jgi:hypothetical protein
MHGLFGRRRRMEAAEHDSERECPIAVGRFGGMEREGSLPMRFCSLRAEVALNSHGRAPEQDSRRRLRPNQHVRRASRKIGVVEAALARGAGVESTGLPLAEIAPRGAISGFGNIKSVGRSRAAVPSSSRAGSAPDSPGSRANAIPPLARVSSSSEDGSTSNVSVSCPGNRFSRDAASRRKEGALASVRASGGEVASARVEILGRGVGSPAPRRSSIHSAAQASTCACTHCSYSSAIFARNRETRSKREIRNASSASWDDVERYSSTDLFADIHGSLAYWVRPAQHGPKTTM